MTPQETYAICKKLIKRKRELELQNAMSKQDVLVILNEEFSLLKETKPYIYKNLVTEKISLDQFKQFAESAETVMSQLHNTDTNSDIANPPKPPKPVIFE